MNFLDRTLELSCMELAMQARYGCALAKLIYFMHTLAVYPTLQGLGQHCTPSPLPPLPSQAWLYRVSCILYELFHSIEHKVKK